MSWKGDLHKSGGLITNIGIHLFDFLIWVFGSVKQNDLKINSPTIAHGMLSLKKAKVEWFLSINKEQLLSCDKSPCRELILPGRFITFDMTNCNLHLEMYKQILSGKGFEIEDTRQSIKFVHHLR